jgi:arylsulfatase A-like enzyme
MRKTAIIIISAVVLATVLFVIMFFPKREKPLNLLLITVDTLVPAHLGYNGYSRSTSPAVDRLAKEGLVFDESYSVSGWTLPSVATILTGMYPLDHGATDLHWSLDDDMETLASILKGLDYDTRGYVSHVMLKPAYGFAKGFKSYDYSVLNYGHPHDVSTSEQLTDLAIKGLREIKEPFFVWVHYFDPHFRYLAHDKWAGFGQSDVDRYDQEIAYTDYHISRLLTYMKRKRYYDKTIIIFTADHGEEFEEHGGKFHYTLYEEVMKVPLIVKAPSIEPGVNHTVVEQIDLLPTVLSMLNVKYDGKAYPGRNVLKEGVKHPVFIDRERPPPYIQRGVIFKNYKLFVVELADTSEIPVESRGTYAEVTNVHPGVYMFDLANDPQEKVNIYTDTNPEAKEMLLMIEKHFSAERKQTRKLAIDKELTEKLRSLGYIR